MSKTRTTLDAPLLEFRSKVSGIWYRNPKAAGCVDAVRLFTGAELPFLYELPDQEQAPDNSGSWISVEKRLPDPNIEVLVAFENDTVAGTSQWCRVKSPDIMGWLGPAENKGKVITHWMPLPLTP